MQVQIKLEIAWRLRFYMYGLVTVAWMTGAKPDPEKVQRMVLRAMTCRAVPLD